MPTTPRRSRSLSANSNSPAAARKGRANFTPYYQLSVFNERSLSFQAGKGSYATPREAMETAPSGKQCRLILVAPAGRTILDEFTT